MDLSENKQSMMGDGKNLPAGTNELPGRGDDKNARKLEVLEQRVQEGKKLVSRTESKVEKLGNSVKQMQRNPGN